MKKNFLPIFLLVFLLIGLADTSLSAQRKCGSQILHHEKMHNDPVYRANYKAYEKAMQKSLNTSSARANCTEAKFFPVAIHFDWTPTATEQVELIKLAQNQIATLNTAYNGGDCQGGTNSGCYEFFLAIGNHPAGSGVTEGEPAVTFGGTAGADYCATVSGDSEPCNLSNWTGYLNITVNRLAGTKMCTSLGVSHLAGNPITMNSMSVNACAFGSTGIQTAVADATGGANCSCLAATINQGATVTHEIGHFLGLFHTFCADDATKGPNGTTPSGFIPGTGEGCQQPSVCATGCSTIFCDCDMVTDTPAQAYSNGGCPGGSAAGTLNNPSTGNAEAFNNFMDYSDDACMNCFSEGQYTRMATTLASATARASDYKTKTEVTTLAPVVVDPVDPIPTMSEWGLLIFGLLVLNLGVFSIRRGSLNTNDNISL